MFKAEFKQEFKRIAKIIFLLLLMTSNGTVTIAQDIYFEWAKKITRSTSRTEGYGIGVDAAKNVYIAGTFVNTMDLDPGPGEYNVYCFWEGTFIVKLNAVGEFVWGRALTGDRFTTLRNLHVTPDGSVYLAGGFNGTTDFDPGPAAYNVTAPPRWSDDNYDLFTLKLDTDGNFKWVQTAGSISDEFVQSVTTDNSGNVYTTGVYFDKVDFDPGPAVSMLGLIGYSGSGNTFIAKYDSDGHFIWAKEFTGDNIDHGQCVRVDNSGNIYVSGIFEGTVDFDPGPAVHTLTSPFYSQTHFLAKLDPNGNLLWVNKDAGGSDIAVNDQQEVVAFDGYGNFFSPLIKYDINGKIIWSIKLGGRYCTWPSVRSSALRFDAAGQIYVTGEFNYTSDFDPGPGTYNLTAVNGGYNFDAFVMRLDPDGKLVWVKQFGNFGEEHPSGISVDADGNVYTVGIFYLTVDFDPGPGVYNISTYDAGGIFVQKLSRCANVTYATLQQTACNSYTLNNHLYTKSGVYTQTLANQFGCDSILTLQLTLLNKTTDISATSCDNYNWNNRVLTTSGQYTETFIAANGCDSTVNLNLVIRRASAATINARICEGDEYEGYRSTGIYQDHFTSANGCDSLRTLQLTVLQKKYSTVTAEICAGQKFAGYSTTGIYTDRLISAEGCDSIRTLHLIVHPVYDKVVKQTICRGNIYMGHTTAGIYRDVMHTAFGCDSIQTTELTIVDKPQLKFPAEGSVCPGDSLRISPGVADSYRWQDGSTLDHFTAREAGLYAVTATNSCGSVTASIVVKSRPCTIYFPNAFSPNADGKNDQFGILNAYDVKAYHLRIFNRWGAMIFESNNPGKGWDGTLKGILLQPDIFVWQCTFQQNNEEKNLKGTVVLIR